MSQNDVAGAASPGPDKPEVNPDTAVEIFPLRMDKDFAVTYEMDLRPQEVQNEAPKGLTSSAQASATTLNSVTGMEDVSEVDLDDPASQAVAKVTSQVTT